jgi:hypothetical protein
MLCFPTSLRSSGCQILRSLAVENYSPSLGLDRLGAFGFLSDTPILEIPAPSVLSRLYETLSTKHGTSSEQTNGHRIISEQLKFY